MAAAGESPEVVLEATYGRYWAADVLADLGPLTPCRPARRRDDQQPQEGACPQPGNRPWSTHSTIRPLPRPGGPTALPFLRLLNSMRRAASVSRTYGRSAVGLQPILGPDAYSARLKDGGAKAKKINNQNQVRMGS